MVGGLITIIKTTPSFVIIIINDFKYEWYKVCHKIHES